MDLKFTSDQLLAIQLTLENSDRVKRWLRTLPANPISPGNGSISPDFAKAHLMDRCRHPDCAFQVRLISVHNHTHHKGMPLDQLYPVTWTSSGGSTSTGTTFLTAKSHQTASDGGETKPEEPNEPEELKEPQELEELGASMKPEELEKTKEPDGLDELPVPEELEELDELKRPEGPGGQEKQTQPEEREEHKKLEEDDVLEVHNVPEEDDKSGVHSELEKHDEPEELPPRKQAGERPRETEEMDYLATRVKERMEKPRKKPQRKPEALHTPFEINLYQASWFHKLDLSEEGSLLDEEDLDFLASKPFEESTRRQLQRGLQQMFKPPSLPIRPRLRKWKQAVIKRLGKG
ncbi:TPA_exp: Uncharacterized protein A8136_4783 [Trichophyton benhamiae CBS 112371]|uniref:Uncharacterized protein n=1 Tax=Arthroderma benhamiae (strain ATCC MYA-4681 / CBS 112371) TaxID=663331 RepID=D4B396_ARTBC|nr:uncharacterized protein ARB_02931 [Trichophyton benhamiae CBS 112371]EFE30251.1 hypothetical protein ARB_02931 [Trichophyton benhamiae CBS 112371]DAA73473.1 TPA_exp: Uncharacterized protein A8136_4783 [Trichophyton benhamiae CBS 112371]